MKFTEKNITLSYEEHTGQYSIEQDDIQWKSQPAFKPYMKIQENTIYFRDAAHIHTQSVKSGIGNGIRTTYSGFVINEKNYDLQFETYIWMESSTGDLIFQWIPLKEDTLSIDKVYWPAPIEFRDADSSAYSLVNTRQGLMIPQQWGKTFGKPWFDGRFGTAGSYMPWFAQVKENHGYLMICETPWNAGYYVQQPEDAAYTELGVWHDASLGKMAHIRTLRFRFLKNCDYNKICKEYRRFVMEHGGFRSLKEKALRQPKIQELIESAFVHTGIKTYVNPASSFFDKENPEKNNHLTTFDARAEEISRWHDAGVKKLYLHLDGWAEPGYDNQHPDYYPVCKEAGSLAGILRLQKRLQDHGDLFGIHDQYRDYYLDAESFSEDDACRLTTGDIFRQSCWAGGPQSYLCTSLAPYYVKRNFTRLKEDGICLDAAYLDVFTCNEGDECTNPHHPMTRRESYGYRLNCFAYLEASQILASSEEVNDWAIPNLIFCHYAPYDFMMVEDGMEKRGLPLPLFNLVYHDCLVIPWMMDKVHEHHDYMLYALLNGGAPYLQRDGAYSNIDGAFGSVSPISPVEQVKRCEKVTELYKQIAYEEMLSHEFVNGNPDIQRTTFGNGITVTINTAEQSYEIAGTDIL